MFRYSLACQSMIILQEVVNLLLSLLHEHEQIVSKTTINSIENIA